VGTTKANDVLVEVKVLVAALKFERQGRFSTLFTSSQIQLSPLPLTNVVESERIAVFIVRALPVTVIVRVTTGATATFSVVDALSMCVVVFPCPCW
jgi:hypothetical protein